MSETDTLYGLIKAEVARLAPPGGEDTYRQEWLRDPALSLCASCGIERGALLNSVPQSTSHRIAVERYSAVIDALKHLVWAQGKYDKWDDAMYNLHHVPTVTSVAWTTAVVLAFTLDMKER